VSPDEFVYSLFTGYPVNGCTTLIPKQCFETVGLFNNNYRTIQDYEMWFRLAKHYRFEHIPEILVQFRLHPGQGSRTMSSLNQVEANRLFVWALESFSLQEIFGINPAARSQGPMRFFDLASICYLNLAVCLWERKLAVASRHAFRLSLRSLRGTSMLTKVYGYLTVMYGWIWLLRLGVWHWRHRPDGTIGSEQ